MIKIGPEDYKLIRQEFDKGNNLWFVKIKDKKKYSLQEEIIVIKWMKSCKMEYDGYVISTTTNEQDKVYNGKETTLKSWNFDDYNFYVLTKEEAKPYLKKIMMNKLISGVNK